MCWVNDAKPLVDGGVRARPTPSVVAMLAVAVSLPRVPHCRWRCERRRTQLGVPSTTPGGTPQHYRDNRVHYFLTHPSELVAIGGVGVVFGAGWGTQTNITTDNGQFKTLSTAYRANPAPLP